MNADPGTAGALIAAEAAARTATFALIGVFVTALISAAVTLWSLRANRRLQSNLKEMERQTAEHIAALENQLAEEKAEHDAEREYEYEARKRLYKEAEPVLFRLGEAAENALYRVISLARTARNGNLGSTERSWLSGPGYYMASTIYNLLAPAAVFRLLQDRLTLVDLGVDSRIQMQYLLAKIHYLSFTEDFALANTEPKLIYAPFEDDWKAKRAKNPGQYWRQGTNIGWVDTAVDSLLVTDGANNRRVGSFSEFESLLKQPAFAPFVELFLYFDPAARPVLWRILVLQAVTCRNLLVVLRERSSLLFSQVPSAEELRHALDYGPAGGVETGTAPFATVDAYYREHYPALIKRISTKRSNTAAPADQKASLSDR